MGNLRCIPYAKTQLLLKGIIMHKQLRTLNNQHIFWRLLETPLPETPTPHIAWANGRFINQPKETQLCRQSRSGRKYVIVFL